MKGRAGWICVLFWGSVITMACGQTSNVTLGIVDETYPSGKPIQDDFRYREVQAYDIRDSFPLYMKITEHAWTNAHWDYSVEGMSEVL